MRRFCIGVVFLLACGGSSDTPPADAPPPDALDAESIYWTTEGIDVANGTVMKVPRAGGAPVSLATGHGTPSSIAVVDGFVYWTSRGTPGVPNTGSVNRVAIAGGAITEIAAAQPSPFSLAVDATHVTGRTRPPAR